MANQLCQQFAAKDVEKHYLAIVRGNMYQADTLNYALKEDLYD